MSDVAEDALLEAAARLREALDALAVLPRDPCSPHVDGAEFDSWVARTVEAWATPLGNVHRQVRMPPQTWAALAASGAGKGLGSYARFLAPDALLGVDASAVEAKTEPLLDAAVDAWLALCRVAASQPGADGSDVRDDLDSLTRLWSQPARALDPTDDVSAGAPDEPGNAVPKDVAALLAATQLRVDQAARRALGRFLSQVPPGRREELAEVAPSLIAGLWGGSVRSPRLQAEWRAAADVADIARVTGLSSVADVATARALLLARTGPVVQHPDAWLTFATWAFGRTASWPRFSSPDPELHRRLATGQYEGVADAAQGELWPAEVVEIVTVGRLPEPKPVIDRPRPGAAVDDLLAELDALIGLDDAKRQIREWVALERLESERQNRGERRQPVTRHLVLTGNPGTGKTTLARLIARIYRALGVLSRGEVVEVTRADLVGQYLGQTEKRTQEAIARATGGVLFIDEAYALASDAKAGGYGQSAIDVLVAEMENRRDQLVVIVAGYPASMAQFLDANPGLASRFQRHLSCPDLSDEAMADVFLVNAEQGGYQVDRAVRAGVVRHFHRMRRTEGFGNARAARNVYDVTRQRLASRYATDPQGVDVSRLTVADLPTAGRVAAIDERRLQTALDALDRLIGLPTAKAEMHQLVAKARHSAVLHARGIDDTSPSAPHMTFVGPPGTGKTTVARMIGEILASVGLLSSGHVVTAGRGQLVGEYIGQTAPKVLDKVREARGGILFIDEAYALAESGSSRDFGREALAALVEEMENRRGEFVVVMAGYPAPMQRLLDVNEGLRSRVGLQLAFDGFTLSELERIAVRTAVAMRRALGAGAARAVAESAFAMRGAPGYANARTVRTVMEAADGNLAQRLLPVLRRGAEIGDEELSTIQVGDVPTIQVDRPEVWGLYL